MKKHKGLTRGKSIFFHILQQVSAYVAFISIFSLVIYSFTSVKTGNANHANGRLSYDWNLFSEADLFEDTGTFDSMLMDALQEIIRYNVAKSQLEVDDTYDGNKIIDVRAFVNRKNELKTGLEVQNGVSGVSEPTAEYYLADLLKWSRYGVSSEIVTMTEYDFVHFFDAEIEKWYDGKLTYEQLDVLEAALGGTVSEILLSESYESYGYDTITIGNVIIYDEQEDKATLEKEEATEEAAEAVEVYSITPYPPQMHQALADMLLQGVPINDVYVDADGNVLVEVEMLQERYLTVDNTSLTSLVNSWKDYFTLISQVKQAVFDLAYNYNEYLNFNERYSGGATNIVYVFEMTMMGEKVLVSNMPKVRLDTFYQNRQTEEEDTLQSIAVDKLDAWFKTQYGKYMIYRPQTMTFESNTGIIEEADLFDAFVDYEYAYPETAQIWLAVDTTYPDNDQFAQAAAAYGFMHPLAYVAVAAGIAAMVLWGVLFLYLSVTTGYRKQKKEDEPQLLLVWFDMIPTEIALLLGGGLAVCILYGSWRCIWDLSGPAIDYLCNNRLYMTLLTGAVGTFISSLFCLFWYSLMRRIKAHILWKRSLLYLMWKGIVVRFVTAVKKALFQVYDGSGSVIRSSVVIAGIGIFNFAMGMLFYRYRHSFAYYGFTGYMLLFLFFCVIVFVNGCLLFAYLWHQQKRKKIIDGIGRIKDGEVTYQVDTSGMHGENLRLAEAVNSIGEGIKVAVETSMKDERLKADLITNVSHDIKTPLTSIINYVDLIKREKIETEPIKGYIEILDAKSQRLKQLTDDLVEASKISSGNITLIMEKINLTELLHQSLGEFSEKFEEKNLSILEGIGSEAVYIEADSRRIWRVIENLFGNIYKYALQGTRVYLDMFFSEDGKSVSLSLKNISAQPLNINADELTERFIRGDVSRSTEGSGLGLSIAKNLTELQNGKFNIYLDGDLFKVTLTFPVYAEAIRPVEE